MASNSNFLIFAISCLCTLYLSEACNNTLVTKKAYFDVYIGDDYWGRMIIGLFGDTTPITALNFATYASNYKDVGYRGTIFHQAYDFAIIGGDFVGKPVGTGSISIFNGDQYFPDENFIFRNYKGWVGMANSGSPNTNGNQFFINLSDNLWLDGQYVVFGKVLSGLDVAFKIASLPRNETTGRPLTDCTITWSGTFLPLQPYYVPYQNQW
jgi:cyclophilin family peptidyl-prolyl cis-trans isomerase